jgi:ribonucleoside-diphosphate reductase beta chain
MTHKAVDWNSLKDQYVLEYWNMNIQQFWVDTEFTPTDDKMNWQDMRPEQREVYKRVLGGLTLLDTKQSKIGIPSIAEHVDDLTKNAVLSFMGMMEAIHAKSYSTIFATLATKEENDEIHAWVEQNKFLQRKADIVEKYYLNIHDKKSLYMAMVASVFLESFLFYSGFFYPLYLSGQGIMTSSGEIINMIIRDESIHGSFIGILAQEIWEEFTKAEQDELYDEIIALLLELYANEALYTDELYAPIELEDEVKKYVRYRANQALQTLGFDSYFPEEVVNQIVLNGILTKTKQHDFFSKKGNGYIKTVHVKPLTDADFEFEWLTEEDEVFC